MFKAYPEEGSARSNIVNLLPRRTDNDLQSQLYPTLRLDGAKESVKMLEDVDVRGNAEVSLNILGKGKRSSSNRQGN